jgi:hypothetical protein
MEGIQNYFDQMGEPRTQAPHKRMVYESKELHMEKIAIAYVVRNADGSFTQVKMHKSSIQAVWTTVVAETKQSDNSITEMRLAPLHEWENPQSRKRNVFSQGKMVQPNECLRNRLQRMTTPMENPVLLVCWDKIPCRPEKTNKRKQWKIVLFTNGTDTTNSAGGPIVLVHTSAGTMQLDEDGIQSVASSLFINWLQNKVHTDGWEIISLMAMAASVRFRE